MDPSGRETDLLNFIRDAAGNIYGTTAYGGDFGDGTVFTLAGATDLTPSETSVAATSRFRVAARLDSAA